MRLLVVSKIQWGKRSKTKGGQHTVKKNKEIVLVCSEHENLLEKKTITNNSAQFWVTQNKKKMLGKINTKVI